MQVKLHDRPCFKNVSPRPSDISHGNGLYAYGNFSIWLGYGLDIETEILHFVTWCDFFIHTEPFVRLIEAIALIQEFDKSLKGKTKRSFYERIRVDDEDRYLLDLYTWGIRGNGYITSSVFENQKSVSLHRIIMQAKKEEIIDHIDGNKLNNTRANLRNVSASINSQNRHGVMRNSTTRIRGVFPYYKHGNLRFRAAARA